MMFETCSAIGASSPSIERVHVLMVLGVAGRQMQLAGQPRAVRGGLGVLGRKEGACILLSADLAISVFVVSSHTPMALTS